jgi:dsDNA-specific endonuclease/ATPase MutS2
VPSTIGVGDAVQTALGKGVVLEVRRHGRLLVEVKGRALELDGQAVSRLDGAASASKRHTTHGVTPALQVERPGQNGSRVEVDLHGSTVDEALARVETIINDALLDDRSEVRLIHGRSGGRIRGALHRRLREIPSVRAFHLDPQNAGVTIVVL